jgi:predicted alpha/beta-hydrolase family hydrolase
MRPLINGSKDAPTTLILAHGAGAPMDSPFMTDIAAALGSERLRVVRFEFPYMAERRTRNVRRAPDREPVLLESWRKAVVQWRGTGAVVIGGKSLGGRIATMIADESEAAAVVCLGYPFHPPGNPNRARIKHLEQIRTPTLIVQGTRDSFGRPYEIANYHLSRKVQIEWIEDGDHSFKPRARSGRTHAGNIEEAIVRVREFIGRLNL